MENNGWTFFNGPNEFGLLKSYAQKGYLGYVYILEFGGMIKIGCTHDPKLRMINLSSIAKYNSIGLGRLALSKECTNYYKLEKELHNYFQEYRKDGTELFDISFEYTINHCPKLNYLDESIQIKEEADVAFETFKNTMGLEQAVENLKNPKWNVWENHYYALYLLKDLRCKYEEAIQQIDQLIDVYEEYIFKKDKTHHEYLELYNPFFRAVSEALLAYEDKKLILNRE